MAVPVDDYRRWLEAIRYRPNWSFSIVGYDEKLDRTNVLHLAAQVEDSCDPDHPIIEVIHRFPLPDEALDRNAFNAFVYEGVLKAEAHEAAEWFVVDGERVHDPHHPSRIDELTPSAG